MNVQVKQEQEPQAPPLPPSSNKEEDKKETVKPEIKLPDAGDKPSHCVGCLESFGAHEVVQVDAFDVQCRHFMCKACHSRLDHREARCPLCRRDITLSVIHPGANPNPSEREKQAAVFLKLKGENGKASPFNTAVITPKGVVQRSVVTPRMAAEMKTVFCGPPFNQPDPGLSFFMLPANGHVFLTEGSEDVQSPCFAENSRMSGDWHTNEYFLEYVTVICKPGPDGRLVSCVPQPGLIANPSSFDASENRHRLVSLHAMTDNLEASIAKQVKICQAARDIVDAAVRWEQLDEGHDSRMRTTAMGSYHDKEKSIHDALLAFREEKLAFCKYDEKTSEWKPAKYTKEHQTYARDRDVAAAARFTPEMTTRCKALRAVHQLWADHINFLSPRSDDYRGISTDVLRAFLGNWDDFPAAGRKPGEVRVALQRACDAYLQMTYHEEHGGDGPLLRAQRPRPAELKELISAKKRKSPVGEASDSGKRSPPSLE